MIRQHETTASGRCLWCGAKPEAGGGFGGRSCIERAALAPEPARRIYACEDGAAIAGRLAELAAERAAGTAQPQEPPAIGPGDCCV